MDIPTATEAKSFLKSKTIFGIIVAAVGLVAQKFFGTSLDEATGTEVANNIVNLVGLGLEAVGLVVAAWGRFKATGPLSATGKTPTATGLILALVLLSGPAYASDGGGLIEMSLWAYAINLVYALGGALLVLLFWFYVVDKYILSGFDTRAEMKKGNIAVAQSAGLMFLGICVLVGLALG